MTWKVLLILTSLVIGGMALVTNAATVGDPAPAFRLPALNGAEVALEAFQGKVVLVNFWASWCAPCREELPALQKLYDKYRTRAFEIVGINLDKQHKNALASVARYGLRYTVLHDPEASTIKRYQGQAMPCSYLLDRTGVIREVYHGFSAQKFTSMDLAVAQWLDAPAE